MCPTPLMYPTLISILGDKKNGIAGFYFPMSLFLFFRFFQCCHLILIKDYTLLFHFSG